jgi:hypothetical protein
MLKKSNISPIKAQSEEWFTARLAKFTSSEIHYLTYPTGLTDGSLSYIRRKVGEELTGKPCRDEILTPAMLHGHLHEAAAVRKFGQKLELEFIVIQQLIIEPETRFGGTPDGLIVLRVSPDGLEYEVETVEVKCPPSFDAYIGLFECDTPADVKKEKREYYWQVLDQMLLCGAKRGHFVIYHPDFKAGNHKSITFNPLDPVWDDKLKKKTFPIHTDLKLLRDRKQEAVVKFEQIRSKLMAVQAI